MTGLQKSKLLGRLEGLFYDGITIVSLAKKLRVSQPTVSRWISGTRFPTDANFTRIARFIKKSK